MAGKGSIEHPAFKAAMGKGRPKGVPNKVTTQIKEMIVAALDRKGGVEYLVEQADKNPVAFMGLLAKIIPMQLTGEGDGPISIEIVRRVVDPRETGD